MTSPRPDQFVGAVLGCALGDAVGAPVEMADNAACVRYIDAHIRPRDFTGVFRDYEGRWPFGQVTDDTQFTRLVAENIICFSGLGVDAWARGLVASFLSGSFVGLGNTTRGALQRLSEGVPWDASGGPSPGAGNGSAMRAGPVGLFHWDDLSALVKDTSTQAIVTHNNPVCTAGAVAIAGAVALAVQSGCGRRPDGPDDPSWWASLAAVVDQVEHQKSNGLSFGHELLEVHKRRHQAPAQVLVWLRRDPRRDGISSHVVPSVLWALYAFVTSPGDLWKTLQTAIWPGGDVDSTAAMACAISGALNGAGSIPADVAEHITDNGQHDAHALRNLALRLHDVTVTRAASGDTSRSVSAPDAPE